MPKPTKWRKTTMRGCRPGCLNMHLPVESRIVDGKIEVRHIWKPGEVWHENEQESAEQNGVKL